MSPTLLTLAKQPALELPGRPLRPMRPTRTLIDRPDTLICANPHVADFGPYIRFESNASIKRIRNGDRTASVCVAYPCSLLPNPCIRWSMARPGRKYSPTGVKDADDGSL